MRALLALALALAIVAPAVAATPFADVPKTHWAYDAIEKAVDAGILQGYDGKFHGQRLLNRYQMAVIVQKILEAVKADTTGTAGRTMSPEVPRLLEEFGSELALLNTKVSTLEGTTQELKKDLDDLRGPSGTPAGNGLGFTAFLQVGLESTDDGTNGYGTAGSTVVNQAAPLTRYNDSADSLFFTLPQASIGVDKEVNPGVYFHAQFDYASDVNASSGVAINEAFLLVDEIFGDIGGKVGAFAMPYSMEHNGPFRTCNYTVTPSFVNVINEGWRGYGVQFQRTKDVNPSDIVWNVGIVSGTDAQGTLLHGLIHGGTGTFSDAPVAINQGEGDDGFGMYLFVGKKPEKTGLGWQLGYFDNGGDQNPGVGLTASPEISYWQVGAEWWAEKFGVMAQYLFGEANTGGLEDDEFAAWYLLFNVKMDDKNNATLRYDHFQSDPYGSSVVSGADYFVGAWTIAFNHKVTENSLLQFEYILADSDVRDEHLAVGTSYGDTDDDLIQIRYKVHF